MLFLRSSLFLIASQIVLIFVVLLLLLIFYSPFKYRYKIGSLWGKFNTWWLGVVCGIRLKVIGQENIPKKPCVIVSNHQSTWETFAFQKIFPQQTWVLKKELLWIPIFGWGLALLKPIIINRGKKLQALKKIVKQGVERIKEDIFVVIFPEGTRQPYGKLGQYQKGGISIAKKGLCDIVPVYHNAGKLWPKGSFIKHAGTITVVVGKPINVKDKSTTTLIKEVKDWTETQERHIKNS